jgi:hypothetical protein
MAELSTAERKASSVAMQQQHRPLYGEQSDDKKYSMYKTPEDNIYT